MIPSVCFFRVVACVVVLLLSLVKASNGAERRECGIIVYIHVGKTGGTTVFDHLQRRRYVREFLSLGNCNSVGKGKYGYEDQWQTLSEIVRDMSTSKPFKTRTPKRTNKWSSKDKWEVGPPASDPHSPWWAFVHSHTCAPGLLWSFDRYMEMKKKMEESGSGCKMILSTTVREPESRFWSNYFYQAKNGKKGFEIPKSKSAKEQHAINVIKEHPNPQSTVLAFNCDLVSDPQRPNCSAAAASTARVSTAALLSVLRSMSQLVQSCNVSCDVVWCGASVQTWSLVDDSVVSTLMEDLQQLDVVGRSHKLTDFVNELLRAANFTEVGEMPHDNKNSHHEDRDYDLAKIREVLHKYHGSDFKLFNHLFPS